MTWIKTSSIEVPAHANQTTEVAINEWFNNNRSFLLGTPVANQLRGTAGGWAQTMAVAPIKDQDTVGLLRDRLSQILQMAKGDGDTSPSQSTINEFSNKSSYGDTSMATIISSDKFESPSPFAFILRENAKPHGIEIHFPPDSSPDAGFIGRIAAAGFEKARTNPDLWYCNYSEAAMTKARGWVRACQKNGAYEISPNEPVEQTKSRRRSGGAKQATAPTPTPAPTPAPATPAGGNKIVDAIADRVQQMLDAMKAELTVDTSELYVLRTENERLKAELQESNESRQKYREALEAKVDEVKCLEQDRDRANETINRQRESIDMAVSEVARLGDIVEERDRVITSLRQQLAEWGVVEVESEPTVPMFEDEPEVEAPVFDDEPPVFEDEPAIDTPNFDDDEEVVELGEPPLHSSSEPEPDDTSEGEGFDFDSLGEI